MTFSLCYELDYQRVMSAVINDSRSIIPAVAGMDGNGVFAYIQTQWALVTPGVLVYRIVGDNGVMCGFVGVSGNGVVLFQQLRPAFVQFAAQISQIIATFITSNTYRQDVLY